MLTDSQIKRIQKAKNNWKGLDLKILSETYFTYCNQRIQFTYVTLGYLAGRALLMLKSMAPGVAQGLHHNSNKLFLEAYQGLEWMRF